MSSLPLNACYRSLALIEQAPARTLFVYRHIRAVSASFTDHRSLIHAWEPAAKLGIVVVVAADELRRYRPLLDANANLRHAVGEKVDEGRPAVGMDDGHVDDGLQHVAQRLEHEEKHGSERTLPSAPAAIALLSPRFLRRHSVTLAGGAPGRRPWNQWMCTAAVSCDFGLRRHYLLRLHPFAIDQRMRPDDRL